MSARSFTDELRIAVAAMQAAHPEKADALSRAHAAIVEGHVVDQGDGTGRVLSRNGHVWYTVNSHCQCTAGEFKKDCRHMHAWKLYRYIQGKVEGQTPPVQGYAGTVETPLPEAPASVNLKVVIAGHEVMVTLRDRDEAALLTRLHVLLKRSDIRPIPKPAPKTGNWKGRQYQGR